jgi:hypothetical protein
MISIIFNHQNYRWTKILGFCLPLALVLLSSTDSYGRENSLKGSAGEIVCLHTDRSVYAPGESILFKAYVTSRDKNLPSVPVNNLYLGVIDQEGLEVAKGIFPIIDGKTAGTVGLSELLAEGNYLILASSRQMNNAIPGDICSEVIEIRKSEKQDFSAVIILTDTLYNPGSKLNAKISFSGSGGTQIPVSYSYQLTASAGEILSGKSKSGKEGYDIISFQLPSFKKDENLTLLVTASDKGRKKIAGIVIPTAFNKVPQKKGDGPVTHMYKEQLKIMILPNRQEIREGERIMAEIKVTDLNGAPVSANLSVSALNSNAGLKLSQKDDLTACSFIDYDPLWCQTVLSSRDTIPQVLNTAGISSSPDQSIFTVTLRTLFAGYLSTMMQSPGSQFIVQEKNSIKKINARKEMKAQQKQEGYSPDRNIFDILMQIKPYHMVDSKIVFTSSGVNSLNNQDGAIIVIDGIKSGTDSKILNNISVADIAKITASTNVMDVQRYTGFNNVGVIEIFTKKGENKTVPEEKPIIIKSSALFWDPDLTTNTSGKTTISFVSSKSSAVIISVAGITEGGSVGCKVIQLPVN